MCDDLQGQGSRPRLLGPTSASVEEWLDQILSRPRKQDLRGFLQIAGRFDLRPMRFSMEIRGWK